MKYLLLISAVCILGACAKSPSALTKNSQVVKSESSKISFTLRNASDTSIPLLIPGVMNPNLSPNSDSGVTLKIGQEILYRKNVKSRVLLVVDESIEQGSVIEISQIYADAIAGLE